MSKRATYSKSVTVLGDTYSIGDTIETDVAVPFEKSLAAAKTGQLTTRTDNDTGVITLAGGHNIVTGRVDVYWDGGSRIGMDGTVAVNALTVDGGEGDNLPLVNTNVTVMNPNAEAIVVVGDNVSLIAAKCLIGATIVIALANSDTIAIIEVTSDQPAYSWTNLDGSDNPLAGETTAIVYMSHGDSTQSGTVTGVIMYS